MATINIDQAGNIAGWMTYKELKWLAKQAQKYHLIVEIGSYLGRSTRALGDHTTGVVYAVDDFRGPRDKAMPVLYSQHLFETFMYNLADLIQIGRVIPVATDHTKMELSVNPDMVFIDGSHEYQDVKRDIERWKNMRGLLCGHDYTNIPDVRQAVDETLGKVKVARGTSIWYKTCA